MRVCRDRSRRFGGRETLETHPNRARRTFGEINDTTSASACDCLTAPSHPFAEKVTRVTRASYLRASCAA